MTIYQNDQDFQAALHGPICPRLLQNDAIVINENGWYRTIKYLTNNFITFSVEATPEK